MDIYSGTSLVFATATPPPVREVWDIFCRIEKFWPFSIQRALLSVDTSAKMSLTDSLFTSSLNMIWFVALLPLSSFPFLVFDTSNLDNRRRS